MYINHKDDFPLEVVHNAAARQTLFWEGQDSDNVYQLLEGFIRAVTISADGERQVTSFFFAGDQIGLPTVPTYRFSAEAITNVAFIRHSSASWRAALAQNCQSDGGMLQSIGLEQESVYCRGILLGRQGATSRVAAFLCSILDRLPRQGDCFTLPIPQLDIADYLALSPETVCRSFKQLRQLNIVGTPVHGQFVVRDRSALERAADYVGRC